MSDPALTEPAFPRDVRDRIDEALERVIDDLQHKGPRHDHPLIAGVYRWLRHYLACGGQRLHGVTTVLAHEAVRGHDGPDPQAADVTTVAAAMQLYLHQTLVHDDLYDEDAVRRGWPAAHVALADLFGTRGDGATAPAGAPGRLYVDPTARYGAIAAFAYGKICRGLVGELIASTGFDPQARLDVCAAFDHHDVWDSVAQLCDVYHEGDALPSPQECLENAWLKTGRFYEMCAYAGARLAGAGPDAVGALRTWAGQTGLAYQLTDDLADVVADSEKGQGRGTGVDLLHCKPTYLYTVALERARGTDARLLARWQGGGASRGDAADVIAALHSSGAVEATRARVRQALADAHRALLDVRPPLAGPDVARLSAFSRYNASPAYWQRRIPHGDARSLLAGLQHAGGAPAEARQEDTDAPR